VEELRKRGEKYRKAGWDAYLERVSGKKGESL